MCQNNEVRRTIWSYRTFIAGIYLYLYIYIFKQQHIFKHVRHQYSDSLYMIIPITFNYVIDNYILLYTTATLISM